MNRVDAPIPDGFALYREFIDKTQGLALYNSLLDIAGWSQPEIFLFGKRYKVPRLTAWHGNAGLSYRYSGVDNVARGWLPELGEIRTLLESRLNCTFNTVLLNLYRDGADGMGYHADDEPELGPEPVIASVSLGAKRRFSIKPAGETGEGPVHIELEHGSLLVMSGASQKLWKHAVPKTKRQVPPRINLTFRTVLETG